MFLSFAKVHLRLGQTVKVQQNDPCLKSEHVNILCTKRHILNVQSVRTYSCFWSLTVWPWRWTFTV